MRPIHPLAETESLLESIHDAAHHISRLTLSEDLRRRLQASDADLWDIIEDANPEEVTS